MGTWKVIGSTNRWPRVVNLWEMDGWEPVGGNARAPVPAGQGRCRAGAVVGEGDRMAQRRLRSHSRAGRRTARRATHCAPRVCSAWVCVHTIARTAARPARRRISPPSARADAAAGGARLTLMGAYSVPMRSDEVVLLWAAPDFRHLCRLYDGCGRRSRAARVERPLGSAVASNRRRCGWCRRPIASSIRLPSREANAGGRGLHGTAPPALSGRRKQRTDSRRSAPDR